MRFVKSKSWPWPVLRPYSHDYPRSEFQSFVDLDKLEGSTQLRIRAEFYLGDRNLRQLIEKDRARFALLVSCSTTHSRRYLESGSSPIEWYSENGWLTGRVEITPFIVAHRQIDSFRTSNWHEDYADRSFSIEAGCVLAVDKPSVHWIEPANETPISSIFQIAQDQSVERGTWKCDLHRDPDFVTLLLHPDDYALFQDARRQASRMQTAMYIMNGIYLPALAWLLVEADRAGEEELGERRWFDALNSALSRAECSNVGTEDADRLLDAQRILQRPFGRLPLLHGLEH
ncbi:MAG: hypothetical protein OXH38_01750 [Chloroflexi bacterium]|nr:hypothetical protein [Chloroflexota bacterium]